MTSAHDIAERIKHEFSALSLEINLDDPNVDWSINIPKQSGLTFDLHLNRQGDELHLSVGGFWLEWFPLEQSQVVNYYTDAVIGLISGKYRILEYVRRGRSIGGKLQAPDGDSWKTIGNSSTGILPRSWFSTTRVLQNA